MNSKTSITFATLTISAIAIVRKKADDNKIKLRTIFIIDPISIVGAIVEYAEHKNIDLLVIGSRGLTGFKKLLVGSVASSVVTYDVVR